MLTYVTGNHGKYLSVKERFEQEGIDVDFFDYDFEEPEVNDITFISRAKALNAYNMLHTEVFVTDAGFYIENYPGEPGYPGAFVKRSGVADDIPKLLETMKDVKDRHAYFMDCTTYYDGVDFHTFYGRSPGVITYEQHGLDKEAQWSKLWHVFIPDGSDKTLSEMTEEERHNRNELHTSGTKEFLKWYKTHKNVKKKALKY